MLLTWEMHSALSALLSFNLRLLIAEGFIFKGEKINVLLKNIAFQTILVRNCT